MTDPFTVEERIEIIHAARQGQKWHLAGERLSPLFVLVLTDRWERMVDAPYYEQFFKYLISQLDASPYNQAEVEAHITYRYASIPEKDVRRYMDRWRDDWVTDRLTEFKGSMIQVSQRGEAPDHLVSICQLLVNRYEIKPLTI